MMALRTWGILVLVTYLHGKRAALRPFIFTCSKEGGRNGGCRAENLGGGKWGFTSVSGLSLACVDMNSLCPIVVR